MIQRSYMAHPYFIITKYSHNFAMSQIDPRGLQLIQKFYQPLMQWSLVKENRRFVRKPVKIFAARLKDRSCFRFHINLFDSFIKFLNEQGVHESCYQIVTTPANYGVDIGLELQEGWVLRDYQVPINEYILSPEPNNRKLVEIQTGKGKAQPLDACIKVPGGWKFMRDMKVGDDIIAKDGSVTKVTGVYPQGVKDIYKITFQDGRHTECCLEHLWKIHKTNCIHQSKIVDTAELIRLKSLSNNRVYVDLIDPEVTPDVELPIDPYLLGVLLGDGSLVFNRVTLSSSDQFIVDEVSRLIPDTLYVRKLQKPYDWAIVNKPDSVNRNNLLLDSLRNLNLSEKRSNDKFIPEEYLLASSKQRLHLLQGLMDTDGTLSWCNTPSFTSVSFELALGVQYLVRSLGGLAYITVKSPSFTYRGIKKLGQLAYQVNIRFKKPSLLFRLPRKKDSANDDHQYSESLRLGVEAIEFVGRKEAQCISIEHPDRLYVTDNFIPTHNTLTAMKSAIDINKRICIIIRPMYMDKWLSDVQQISNVKLEETLSIRGSDSLMGLIDMAKNGTLDAKIIIISNKTFQNWLTMYEDFGDEGIEELGYGCTPPEFFQTIGAGLRLIDEVHQDFHLNFLIDLHTHVEKSISLSATLEADDPFVTRMYELAYPPLTRFRGLQYDRYIKSASWSYRFSQPEKIRTKEFGSASYSHLAFEKSVIKNPVVLEAYIEMIEACVRRNFLEYKKPGDKLLIYCSSIDMCTKVSEALKKIFKEFDVRRYVEQDPYDNLMSAEICVSTLLSAGTGHDIKGLTTVILTSAVKSSQSNIQGFGRLRKLDDRDTRFIYFVCLDMEKHVDYHKKKREILEGKALSYNEQYYYTLVG